MESLGDILCEGALDSEIIREIMEKLKWDVLYKADMKKMETVALLRGVVHQRVVRIRRKREGG